MIEVVLINVMVVLTYPQWAINGVQNTYIHTNLEDNININNLQDKNLNAMQAWIKQIQAGTAITHKIHNPSVSSKEVPQTKQKPSIGFVIILYTRNSRKF